MPASTSNELPPVLAADLFLPLNEELVGLLRRLSPADWSKSASQAWRVRDVAAHLLDGQLRRLSFQRDALPVPTADPPLAGYADLVAYLDRLNAIWVEAAQRLSPRLMTDLLAMSGRWLSDLFLSLDPFSPALFPVAWAGEAESLCWMDVARELTEQWHHQQQIRHAVGAPLLFAPRYARPVFGTFLRAVPRAYGQMAAAEGTRLRIRIGEPVDRTYSAVRSDGCWRLEAGCPEAWQASASLDPETAWRVFTRGLPREESLRRLRLEGDEALGAKLVEAVAIMV